ncbi:MAG TPA: dihydrodipicolinate synthase family protein [Chitinophagaceae bacterium]|nr:dihydrodipicolinate synthase family protein [Chitinophagaceae bacterium]
MEWKGVMPAMITPFTEKDELDLPLFSKNLDAQLAAGVEGIILGGSLGEASVLTTAEKERLVSHALQQLNGKLPVVMNIAEGSTNEALKQVLFAESWGVQGLMLLPPMRYTSDHRETVTYFKTIAAATDLPIMIYNNPIDYKIEVTMEMFDELMDCPNINAVKESTREVNNINNMRSRFGDRFKILCGVDTIALDELMMGADGWVAGLVCAFPAETVKLYTLAKEGRIKEAEKLNHWFMPLLELDVHPKLVQYIKLAATQTGLGSEYVRPPRLMLQGEERERILKIINKGIAERPEMLD